MWWGEDLGDVHLWALGMCVCVCLCTLAPPFSGDFESVMVVSEQDLQLPLTECYSGFCSNCTASVSVCMCVCDCEHESCSGARMAWSWLGLLTCAPEGTSMHVCMYTAMGGVLELVFRTCCSLTSLVLTCPHSMGALPDHKCRYRVPAHMPGRVVQHALVPRLFSCPHNAPWSSEEAWHHTIFRQWCDVILGGGWWPGA